MLLLVQRELLYFLNNKLFLFFNDLTDSGVVDGRMNMAFHHCSSLIVLDIPLPSIRAHPAIFTETLLSKVAKSKIISIGHEVLNLSSLHFL
jgi:hypothetical protein